MLSLPFCDDIRILRNIAFHNNIGFNLTKKVAPALPVFASSLLFDNESQ